MALTRRDFERNVLAGVTGRALPPLAMITGDATSGYIATIVVTVA